MKISMSAKERVYIISLIKSDREMIGFLRGFGKETEADKNKRHFCDNLINKLSIDRKKGMLI